MAVLASFWCVFTLLEYFARFCHVLYFPQELHNERQYFLGAKTWWDVFLAVSLADGFSGTFPLWVQGRWRRSQGRQMSYICICKLNKVRRLCWPALGCGVLVCSLGWFLLLSASTFPNCLTVSWAGCRAPRRQYGWDHLVLRGWVLCCIDRSCARLLCLSLQIVSGPFYLLLKLRLGVWKLKSEQL